MPTRIGKIARLPNEIREQLNQRLFNGTLGPELLAWLNQLPEVTEVLAEFFNATPINPQNLSEWRHGGYEDWLRHQEREWRIQRIAEQGASLKNHEGIEDVYENSGRIALAELMSDLDNLHKLDDETRWNRLRGLTRELARLQNGFNRSRWAELAWLKWNDRFLGPDDYEEEETPDATTQNSSPNAEFHPVASDDKLRSAECHSAVSPTGSRRSVSIAAAPQLETPVKKPEIKPNQTRSTGGEGGQPTPTDCPLAENQKTFEPLDKRVRITHIIYHPKGCQCVCPNCHPENSEYPHTEALKDAAEARHRGALCFSRGLTYIITEPTECNCPCETCKTPKSIGPFRPLSPLSPLSPFSPNADFLRQAAHRKSFYG